MGELSTLVAIVDDEEAIRRAVKRLLRSVGMNVVTFASGGEFLQSLPTCRPDCVLLDIRMPGLTGFDVQARLHERHAAIPVVFITALDDPADTQRARNCGAEGFLRKPFRDEDLIAAIRGAMRVRSPPTR